MVHGDMGGCMGDMTHIAGDMGPMMGDCSGVNGDVNGMQGDMTGCSGNMTGCTGDMTAVNGDVSDFNGDCGAAGPNDFGDFQDPGPFAPPPMDPFDTGNPNFASPEMTEARAEVNDAAAVDGEGHIACAPECANPDFPPPMPPVAPNMAAGTPEGAAVPPAPGDFAPGGAMDAAFGGPAPGAAPMDINPTDAALGAAMDGAMDQGGVPAPDSAAANDPAAGMDAMDVPGMDDDPQDEGGSDIA